MSRSDKALRSRAIGRNAGQWSGRGRDAEVVELVALIREAANRVGKESEAVIAAHGLTRGTFDVLAALYRHPGPSGLTQVSLARAILLTPAGMKKRLDSLAADGLVSRAPDTTDLRKLRLALTPQGITVMEGVLDEVFITETRALEGLTATARRQLRDLLIPIVDS